MEIIKIVILSLSGLLLLFVGMMRLFKPVETYQKNSGINLDKDNLDLLNEIRGLSGVMLSGGVLILLGTVISQITFTSHVVAILLFLGFAIGRSLSMTIEGKPNKQLIQGLVFELVFGSLNIFGLYTMLA